MKSKVKLDSLKIRSFVTNLEEINYEAIKGGSASCGDASSAGRTWYNTSCVIH